MNKTLKIICVGASERAQHGKSCCVRRKPGVGIPRTHMTATWAWQTFCNPSSGWGDRKYQQKLADQNRQSGQRDSGSVHNLDSGGGRCSHQS